MVQGSTNLCSKLWPQTSAVVFGGREGVSCMRQQAKKAARTFCQTGEKHDENQKLYVGKEGDLKTRS